VFERLTDKFQTAFRSLTGRGRLTESNVSTAMNEIRRALLDADVNYKVAKEFIADVRKECLGDKVLNSVSPGQQSVKVVHDRLVELLGESRAPLDLDGKLSVIMLCGLHGSGKTTTAAKLAYHLREKEGRKVMLAAADLHRPAAIDQLEILGEELGFPVFADRESKHISQVAVDAMSAARTAECDTLIVDTAGRLQVDTELVQDLVELKRRTQPREILLVGDAALGQEAVSVAEHFDEALGITGIILTKLDGDARGGAAVSMRQVTGRPIKFVGVGERHMDLEPFHPDRMAGRILGMGDVVSLVERASEQFEEDEAKQLEEKLRKSTFDFEDFTSQLSKIRKMGGFMSLMKMIPGMGGALPADMSVDDSEFNRLEGMIRSMTVEERRRPEILGTSRRQRIARGSGVTLTEVNQLIKQFTQMRQMMSRLGKGGGGMGAAMGELMSGGGGGGGGGGGMPAGGGYGMGRHGSATKAAKKPRKKREKPKRNKKRR